MQKIHFKANPTFSNPISLNVDRENSIINNVSIANNGENKNGSYFNNSFIDDLVSLGSAQKQGVKSRFGHPNMCATSLGTYIGRYKGFRSNEGKVYANLHLDPITEKTQVDGKGISMHEYILDMAETNPDMFGNSIVISGQYFEEFDTNGKLVHEMSMRLESFVASDLVDDPAATDALFSGSGDMGVLVTRFLDENEEIFDAVSKDESIIEDFLERYNNYYSRKFKKNLNMSFFEKFKKKIGGKSKFDIDETLADGSIVTVKTENENPQVGDAVVDSEGAVLADGDHTTKDGDTWTIVDGLIDSITEKEEEGDDDEEPTIGDVMQSVNSLATAFSQFKTQYGKDLKESHKAIELSHDDLDKKFSTLAKNVKSKSPDYEAGAKEKKKFATTSGYDPDKVREAREARKSPNKK